MNYVNNKELISELIKYKETKVISERFGEMFLLIATNLSKKPNWSSYTWKDDMVQEAIYTCTKYIKNFDLEKSQNPFAYITQICSNSFKLFVKKQKKHAEIKDICYKEIESLEEQKNINRDRAIDYTVLKNKL